MTKRRITRASKRRLTIFGTLSIIAVVYFCISLIYNFYSIYHLAKEKDNLNNTYAELQQKAEDLKLDINKLNDPKYLADYARENYLYSKDDEYILQIEEIIEEKDQIDTINTKINKGYILIGLSFCILLIFVYIIVKSIKKDKKK
jgi:cell division protein FtsB